MLLRRANLLLKKRTLGTTMVTKAGFNLNNYTVWVLSKIPLAAFGFVLVAPYTSCSLIHREQNVMGLPAAPFLSFISNCLTWTIYGCLRRDSTIILANIIGALAGGYFTWTYQMYEPIEAKKYAIAMAMPFSAMICVAAFGVVRATFMVGLMANTAAILLTASPMVQMKKVIDDKDSSTMPFKTSLAFFLNGLAWTAYGGLVLADPFVIIPNSIGAVLASGQLALIAKYPPKKGEDNSRSKLIKAV